MKVSAPPKKIYIYIHISPTSFICSFNNTYTSNQTIVCQDISVSQNVLDPQQLDLLTWDPSESEAQTFPNFPPILTMSSTSPSTQMIHLPTARYPRCCERLRQKNNSCCCLMGILTMAYYNPTQVGSIMPYIPYTTSFFHCSSRNHCELSILPKVLTASKQMTARRHI